MGDGRRETGDGIHTGDERQEAGEGNVKNSGQIFVASPNNKSFF